MCQWCSSGRWRVCLASRPAAVASSSRRRSCACGDWGVGAPGPAPPNCGRHLVMARDSRRSLSSLWIIDSVLVLRGASGALRLLFVPREVACGRGGQCDVAQAGHRPVGARNQGCRGRRRPAWMAGHGPSFLSRFSLSGVRDPARTRP